MSTDAQPSHRHAELVALMSDKQTQVGIEAGLHALTVALRDRTVSGQAPAARTRQLLLHWLAVADWGYTTLNDLLPNDLQACPDVVETVLQELATYRQPSLGHAGFYALK